MNAPQQLAAAFDRLAAVLPNAQFPLPLEGTEALRELSASMQHQLNDYLLPRSSQLDAPLLAVVGGSTGAGKSTLVNSLLGAELTRPGVLRPTTKSPVLVSNPADLASFESARILPGLTRTHTQTHDSRALQIIGYDGIPAGLALLDAPDIDSVDDHNRALSRQLLRAADLWLFVTSAARYADAVGWDILEQAAARNTVVAVVINRCPPEAMGEVTAHLSQMLADRGLGRAQLFAVPEHELPEHGMVPLQDVQPIRSWLMGLAAEKETRAQVALQTLAGAVRALEPQVRTLADGARRQVGAIAELRHQAHGNFSHAQAQIHEATGDGSMLRGEVLNRWQDFVGTGEFMRNFEQRVSRFRDRVSGWFTGEKPAEGVQVAIHDGLAALVVDHAQAACQGTAEAWTLTPWGRQIVEANPALRRPTPEFDAEAARVIREWQSGILRLVEDEGSSKRVQARVLALGTNAVGAALIILVFASTGGLTTAEVGIAGGTSLLAQRLLEGVFGEDAVRRLAQRAKEDLDARVQALLATQLARFEEVLGQLSIEEGTPGALDAVADELRRASAAAFDDLTRPEGF